MEKDLITLSESHPASTLFVPEAVLTHPSLSVVIPVFNEEKNITMAVLQTIDTLKDKNIDHEIIIVDDASRDQTLSLAEHVSAIHPQIKLRHVMKLGICFLMFI